MALPGLPIPVCTRQKKCTHRILMKSHRHLRLANTVVTKYLYTVWTDLQQAASGIL